MFTLAWNTEDAGVQQLMRQMPRLAYRELRELMFKYWHRHRMYWLSQQSNKFGRGGRGVKVHRIGMKGKRTDRSVHYYLPDERTVPATSALEGFRKLARSEIRSDSVVLRYLQTGGTQYPRTRRHMILPHKTLPANYKAWRKKNAGQKKLRWIPAKGGGATKHRIYEVTGKRKKKWRLRFVAVSKTKNKPTLKFYDSWDELTGWRDREFGLFADRVQMLLREAQVA